MLVNDATSNWLTLMDFSRERGVSLSTLRRYIKSKKVKSKMIEGRYFVFDDGRVGNKNIQSAEAVGSDEKVLQAEKNLRKALNEIAELKTLIAFYEESFSNQASN